MRCSKKIILFLVCFATVFSFMIVSASADWNEEVGYYGSVPFNALIQKRDAGNSIIDDENHLLEIAFDSSLQCYRLRYMDTLAWYLNADGSYPYTIAEGDVPDSSGADTIAPPSVSRNKFIDVKNLNLDNIQLVVLSEDALSDSVQLINDDGFACTMSKASINGTWYWVIMRSGGTSAAYYCNSSGQPYVALYEDSATDIYYDYTINDNSDNSITVNDSQIIEINDGVLNLIDEEGIKVSLDIENLTYDTGNKSYTVNAYTTNNEGDTYNYTYYTYNITYNITNTYVTYIGSNDAYEKEEYQYYYQLPDGRSSADLTADEIAGMSFEFHDVVNYAKSATDVSVRALYHFDGDIDDSSYFSTQGKFEWTENASITYMEAPSAFDGTLYLDQEAHAFSVYLPSTLGGGDFTIQFRHYQASEPDTQANVENSLVVGLYPLLSWDESYLYYDGAIIADLPIGTWAEIALIRSSGTLYIYVNGLCVHSVAFGSVLSNQMDFTFGDSSRAYTMLDEMRVLNFALAQGGESYTPTVVPYDSNLVLVLPDSAYPLADEYLEITSSGANLLGYDYTSFTSGTMTDPAPLNFYSKFSSLESFDGFTRLTRLSADMYKNSTYGFSEGLYLGVTSANGFAKDTDYTLSVVLSDGSVHSLTFCPPFVGNKVSGSFTGVDGAKITDTVFARTDFDGGSLVFALRAYSYNASSESGNHRPYISIIPSAEVGSFLDIVYVELVEGTSTDLACEKVTCVYPDDAIQPNTAAVQSDIPVNGYTVGGVRPTLPSKGDVWFPVFENRIQTCYIYTGTMWEEVGCRWYTGSRWIPIYAFNLVTLEDLFDIADADGVVTPLTSESAFWRWWQLQWLDFRKYLDGKFDELIAAITGNPVGSGSDITTPDEEGNSKFSFSDLLGAVVSSVLEVATTVLTEFIGLIADLIKMFIQAVMDFIGGFVGVLSDAAGHITTLGDSVAPIGDFVRGIYDAIPDDIEAVLTGSFVVVVAVSVISFLL